MKRTLTLITLLLLLPSALLAQAGSDSFDTTRLSVKCTSLGVTLMNNLDTYMSGYNHTGTGLHLSHENFRNARTAGYRWKRQTLLTADAGLATLHNDTELAAMVTYSFGGYHPWEITKRLQLLAGAQAQATAGALYIPTNGNNLVSAKMRATLAASAMAIYRIPAKKGNYTLRAQLDVPLIGAMFAPEFGQSYYEIFGLGHNKNTIVLSHPANSPSMRGILSADIPIALRKWSSTIRLTYTADIFQSDVHDTRTHIYNHSFAVGFVKTIYKVKNNDKLKQYSPF